ncbi:unnamed protein product [Spirodela intermedia]|uniref:Uncharacterized protein n=1 Tax=Spirodela intermedia TaxID=51605 RepID=A0A7I8IDM5_SPIIN|nr:unnamed protein product [Spirodela intermedia]CAA6655721.1 unnamed protein product [Spirodela intermedia]
MASRSTLSTQRSLDGRATWVIDYLADYYRDIHKYPVRSQVNPGYLRKRLPSAAPNDPEPIEAILGDITHDILPASHTGMSPNYFAYFPASGSTAGFLGEMLSTGFNVVGFNWIIVMDWLANMLKLPDYGVANLRNFLRGHVKMAKHFEGLVAADGRFEVVVPRTFAMVCFRLLPPKPEESGKANELNQSYMTHAVVGGVYMIRFAVGATLTESGT